MGKEMQRSPVRVEFSERGRSKKSKLARGGLPSQPQEQWLFPYRLVESLASRSLVFIT